MSSKIEDQENIEASMNVNIMATDKVLEKIGDHYNNPEMADRILVVKVRPQGWEMQEAAKLARNYVNKDNKKDKGNSEKTPNLKNTNESKNSTRKNDHKSQSKGAKDVISEPPSSSGAIASGSIVLSDSEVDVEIVAAASDLSCSPVQEAYNSKAGTKRKKNNSEDSIVIPEDILLLKDKDCKCPIDSHCGEGSDLPNPTVVSKTEEAEIETENAVEDSDSEISQADKKICVDVEESLPIYTSVTQQDVESFVVCEHEIYVHSFWLALNSPYFRTLFFSSWMKESKDKKVSMYPLTPPPLLL